MSAAAARVIAHAACAWGLASAASARAAGPAVRSHPQCATVPTFVSRQRCASLTRAVYRHVEAVGDGCDATSYRVYPVAGDGRCLFRSVAAATAIRADGARLSPDVETAEADRLETSPSTNSDDAAPRWSGSSRAISTRTATPCDARSRGAASPRYSCSRTSSSPRRGVHAERTRTPCGPSASYGVEYGEGVAILFHGAGHYEALAPCDES